VDGREHLHRVVVRVHPGELLVDLEDPGQLLAQERLVLVREIEVNLVLVLAGLVVVDTAPLVEAGLENRARSDVARYEVAVPGVHALEDVIAILLGDVARVTLVFAVFRDPHAAAFAARALGDETELVGAGDRRRVHLNALAVAVDRALSIDARRRGAGADHAVGRAAEDDPRATRRETHRIGAERLDGHVLHVLRDDADARTVVGENRGEKVPRLALLNHLFARDGDAVLVLDVDRFEAADLLVERVEELLPGRRAGERRAMKERAAEAAKIEQPFRRTVERHAHAVEHEDDARRRVAHPFDRRLVREKIAAVSRLFEVHLRAVAFAFGVHRRVDAPLSTDRVRTFDGHERKQEDGNVGLAQLDDGHQAAEPTPHDDGASYGAGR
jgi:hypothetical protein